MKVTFSSSRLYLLSLDNPSARPRSIISHRGTSLSAGEMTITH